MSAPKSWSPWPEDRLAKLRRLEADGLTIRQMAAWLNCAPSTVNRQLRHLGLIRSRQPAQPGSKRLAKNAPTLPPLASLAGDER